MPYKHSESCGGVTGVSPGAPPPTATSAFPITLRISLGGFKGGYDVSQVGIEFYRGALQRLGNGRFGLV